jgi:hypothetical protein
MKLQLRKVVTFAEEVSFDMRALPRPFRSVVVAAVMANPWAGKGFVEDLSPVIGAIAAPLGKLLAPKAVEALGGPGAVEAFGKAAMVGLGGEYEHANALIHTTLFGDECRRAAGGSAWMVGNQKICPAGGVLEVPMAHKTDGKLQNYYHTAHLYIHDAPRPDELVVAVGMASGPRPHARL